MPDLEKLGDEYVHIDKKMALSEPLGNFFSIGVPSGLLCEENLEEFKSHSTSVLYILLWAPPDLHISIQYQIKIALKAML